MNCPICNKEGLPDYMIAPIICPQCNSDLKGFTSIEKITIIHKSSIKKYRNSVIVFFVLVLVLFIWHLLFPSKLKDSITEIQAYNSRIEKLTVRLNKKSEELKKIKSSHKLEEVGFPYVVKKGDNLSKIALIFYNDWRMYKKIEVDNRLNSSSFLFPNDTLIIRMRVK